MIGAIAEHFNAELQGVVRYFRSNIQVADDASSYAGVISLSKVIRSRRCQALPSPSPRSRSWPSQAAPAVARVP